MHAQADELRGEMRAQGEELRAEMRVLGHELRGDIAASAADTRRHFDVVAESLVANIQLVAERRGGCRSERGPDGYGTSGRAPQARPAPREPRRADPSKAHTLNATAVALSSSRYRRGQAPGRRPR